MSRAEIERSFTGVLEQNQKGSFHYAISPIGSEDFLGMVSLMGIDFLSGEAEYRTFIAEKQNWDKGYGTDALNATLDLGFGELRLERIWLNVYAYNERAIQAYKNAGLVIEGTRRRCLCRPLRTPR